MKRKPLVALVTGASSGIGEATAVALAAAGYTVYGTSRRGAQTAPRAFKLLALDVTNDQSVDAAVNELLQLEGRIDLLVNNAGFGVSPAAAEESSIEQAKAILDTNFLGVVRMTRAVLPHMRKQGGGRIINIGSIIGLVPTPYAALYAASKHAVEGYSEAVDHELRSYGIRVTVIEPAYTKTLFEANNLAPDAPLETYTQVRTQVGKVVAQAMANADEPAVVADVVVKAARAAHPKVRYTAGKIAGQLQVLRRFVPAGVFQALIRKNLQLDTKAAARAS
ncbi:oxidoreductase [Xanthomonas prunicola]|jgi:NAD(P)-dependent dehydrogenase (short-subunit alcohol dehydrogenase family)|uniref:Short-chain dehydrogenase/reductase n=1 Tax=Xanthomonas prunicola TaxID=2053930 RepID=A0A2N3RHV0_9XANT|nr:oxidoreductase [Xanthomonas prunicola]PKV12006.1 short-chain dehydrogenase/reductase [Xanthomonas prunicola]PKV16282.1 short-chain dehydrogenase/reductase [Xanthomonas prunicola]PKV22948.1 short-chain dehydrogenase/reductase [Xanthomonas prunicola]